MMMAVFQNLHWSVVNIGMRFKTFAEYVQMREGLWVADNKAVEGWSKLPQPKPKKQPTPPKPPTARSQRGIQPGRQTDRQRQL